MRSKSRAGWNCDHTAPPGLIEPETRRVSRIGGARVAKTSQNPVDRPGERFSIGVEGVSDFSQGKPLHSHHDDVSKILRNRSEYLFHLLKRDVLAMVLERRPSIVLNFIKDGHFRTKSDRGSVYPEAR
ncbi:MAG: hypothetical protein ACRCZF_26190 [Gemmataceae bacterium]